MPSNKANVETRNVPRYALRVEVGELKFAAGDPSANPNEAVVSLLARTAQPIQHPWWGTLVHDMAGAKLPEKVLFDWCHDPESIIGYGDQFQTDGEGLTVGGKLVAWDPMSKAAELIKMGQAGTPYQCSIDFNGPGLRLEEVGAGATASVNGYQIAGPATIVREWPLRAVAICPYGADSNTAAQFSADGPQEAVCFTTSKSEEQMSTTTNDKPNETTVDPRAELQRYLKRFGQTGATYFAEGLTFEAALEKHVEDLSTQLTAKDAKITDLEGRLAAVNRGEKPVQFQNEEGNQSKPSPREPKLAKLIRISGSKPVSA